MTPSLRAAVIREWRGLPEKKARPDKWETPGVLLPKLMQKLGLKERLRESEMIDAWSSIVGEFIAAHSAPVALTGRHPLRPRPSAITALRARTRREGANFTQA